MMELFGALLILTTCFTIAYGFQSGVDYDGVLSLKLRHALDHSPNPEFTDRGAITIQSIRTGAVSLQQVSLSAFDRQKLKNLAENHGLYRLNATVRTVDGKEISFLTFVKACSLVESELSDILTVSLDHTGMPVAVTASTVLDGCHEKLLGLIIEDLRNFNTSVFVKHMEQGPVPDTATYIQKLEKEKEARERGETQDNRSFLAKYWMYIVPVVIFVLLSGAANPEGAAGGGGGGGGAGR